MTPDQLIAEFPFIDWLNPVLIRLVGGPLPGEYFGCRVCIASYGLKGPDVPNLPRTREGFDEHMATTHA